MIIYLGQLSLTASSNLPTGSLRATGLRPSLVLLRVGFTRPPCLHDAGELLPHHFNLTTALPVSAVCFCCTFPTVTCARRYLAPLPYGARTFLTPKCATIWTTQTRLIIIPRMDLYWQRLSSPLPLHPRAVAAVRQSFLRKSVPYHSDRHRSWPVLWPKLPGLRGI